MSCPACTSTRLTSIKIRLAPDEDHTSASCQACEWKGWFKEGADVPLGRVLSLASERRVAEMAAEGPTNREIAQALFVTQRTVEVHLTSIYRKLAISSRSQLAAALAEPARA